MIEYEGDSAQFTFERANQLFLQKDANTFMTELFSAATEGAEGSELARCINDDDYDEDLIPAGFEVGEAYSKGGGEGGGETVIRVYEIKYEGGVVYVRATGSYYSHDGTYWNDDFTFVRPKEVTVIKYVDF